MNKFVRAELERLRVDFEETTGCPFEYFFCPVLFRDEDVGLSQVHIINEAFDKSSRECTIQRSDVDSFYGSRFEADFVDIAKFRRVSLAEILANPVLAKRFNAKVLLNGNRIEHFYATGEVPKQFTRVQVGNLDPTLPFGLKMAIRGNERSESKLGNRGF